jgi:hypothetical protein
VTTKYAVASDISKITELCRDSSPTPRSWDILCCTSASVGGKASMIRANITPINKTSELATQSQNVGELNIPRAVRHCHRLWSPRNEGIYFEKLELTNDRERRSSSNRKNNSTE